MLMLKRVVFAASLALLCSQAKAETVVWTIQSSASSVTLAGSASNELTGLLVFSGQDADGLKANYDGTVTTDLQGSASAPTTIQILSAAANAIDHGSYSPTPDGSALLPKSPADYGAKAKAFGVLDVFVALRNVLFDISSGVEALAPGGNPAVSTFSSLSSAYTPTTLDASFRVDALGLGGSASLAGAGSLLNTAGPATADLKVGPAVSTLTLPVKLILFGQVAGADTTDPTDSTDDIFVDLTFSGTIVATSTAVPEPTSLALLGFGAIGLAFAAWRKLRK
jgi:hypothetical protein